MLEGAISVINMKTHRSDQVIYRMNTEGKSCLPEFKPIPTEDKHHAWTNGCVTKQTIDELIQFAEESNVQGHFQPALFLVGRAKLKSEKAYFQSCCIVGRQNK